MNPDVMKHKKKKTSDISKANKKTKHKHYYTSVLAHHIYVFPYTMENIDRISSIRYCKECGKIHDITSADTMETGPLSYRRMTCEEMAEKYKDEFILEIEDIDKIEKEKYINLELVRRKAVLNG